MRRLGAFLAVAATTLSVASIALAQEPDPEHKDLVKLGHSLLPGDEPPRADAAARKVADAGLATSALDAGGDAADAGADAGERDSSADAGAGGGAQLALAGDAGSTATDAGAARPEDAGSVEPAKPKVTPIVGVGSAARKARVESGQNSEQKALAESPIARLGLPEQAVPVVATTAAVGTMAIWPFLTKTLVGLLKKILVALLKSRAKKGEKIDTTQKRVRILGFDLRPAELGALLLGALIYGLAVCYGFQGRSLTASFLVSQEALVVLLYYSRSFIRFAFERRYALPTQFRLWIGGGVLCLVSTYLGATLGTVGYELEDAPDKESATRIVKMKALLTTVTLAMALAFFAANVFHPMKLFQSGRVMMSGIALAEILPFAPMPGKKILAWNKGVWALLAAAVLATFVLTNYFL